MKAMRQVFTLLSGCLLLALTLSLPLRSQLLTVAAIIALFGYLWFRSNLSKKESFPAWTSIVMTLSAGLVVMLIFWVATLWLVQSYQFVSKKIADPYAMHITWLSYGALAVVAWLLFNPKKKEPDRPVEGQG